MQAVSAEIMLSQPNSVYSLGENLAVSAEVSEIKPGFMEINLNCDGKEKNIYNSVLSVKKVELNVPLTPVYIKELRGTCKIISSYGVESKVSSNFIISDKIEIVLNFDKLDAKPGEEIKLSGEAKKANGLVEGFAELKIEDKISLLNAVSKGKIELDFKIPDDMPGKEYSLNVKVYEKLGEEVTNQGEISKIINIANIAKKINIELEKQNVNPGESLMYKAVIYDQANLEMSGNVDLVIKNPKDEVVLSKAVEAGKQENFEINKTYLAGYWSIETEAPVKAKKLFYIEEKEEVEMRLDNDTLIISNTGNVAYKKSVEVSVGDEKKIVEVDLGVGETANYKLAAPEGVYDIKVNDGAKILEFNGVSLTGNAVGVAKVVENWGEKYFLVWIFLVFILGMFVYMFLARFVNNLRTKSPQKSGEKISKVEPIKKEEIELGIGNAEHTTILKGNKEESAVLALRGEFRDKSVLEKISSQIKNKKGVVYSSGNYLLGIFAPSLTGSIVNEAEAVKVAGEIEKLEIPSFGAGINTGSIVTKKEAGRLKFTSLGNTLSLAKKLADISNNEILLSEASAMKTRSLIRAEKQSKQGISYFKLIKFIDRGINARLVDLFLKSQKSK